MAFGVSNTLILAVLVGVIFLIIAGFFARRRLQGGEDAANDDSGTERLTQKEQRESYHVPLKKRVTGMTPESKAIAGGTLVIAVVIGYNLWSYLKTGSPTQMAYATETQVILATLVGGVIFVHYDRKRQGHLGKLRIEHEADPEDDQAETTPETVVFDQRDVIETENGLVVHEYSKRRYFGFFRRAKRVAEDRRLRNDDDVYRPLDDKVGHLIPERATEYEDGVYSFRTKGAATTRSVDSVHDIEYLPAYSMSREERARVNADMDMMKTDLREQSHQLAHKDAKIRRLQTTIENMTEQDWTRFLQFAERLAPLFGRGYSQSQVLQKLDDGYLSRSPRNGEGGEGEGDLQLGNGQAPSRGES